MRDIPILAFILGMVPFMIWKPRIGVMMWIWISVMNPHKFGWGVAVNFPVANVTGIATMIGLIVSRDKVKLPINSTTILIILLGIWMSVTLMFALRPDAALEQWTKVMKVYLFVLITASVVQKREHIDLLIWILVFSVGYFGVKGGLFTILTGGANRVYGPPGKSYLADNNAISVALVMIIPLAYYLTHIVKRAAVKYGLYVSMGLSAIAVLGSQSRGAFLAIVVMSTFFWFRSKQKFMIGMIVLVLLPVAIVSMPDSWKNRMRSIESYEQDNSALGRLNAWRMAFNVANERPLVGGGFELYSLETFTRYAPVAQDVHTAHSIYFQMLGEHGYVGLLLFLTLGLNGWFTARRIIREVRKKPEFAWAGHLARATQISLVGFAVGGAFVNISYWEIPYYELVMLMVALNLVRAPPQAVPVSDMKAAISSPAQARA